MSEVDWSKAPEWATRLMRNIKGCTPSAWADDGHRALWVTDPPRCQFKLDQSVWALIERRPTAPEWDGTGCPPAGTVFEALWSSSLGTYTKALAIGTDDLGRLVFKILQSPTGERVGEFETTPLHATQYDCGPDIRPLRTAEQIAADQRLHDVRNALTCISQKMESFNLTIDCSAAIAATVGAMIDAGYRKQVAS